jgi:hypothetical protein
MTSHKGWAGKRGDRFDAIEQKVASARLMSVAEDISVALEQRELTMDQADHLRWTLINAKHKRQRGRFRREEKSRRRRKRITKRSC